MFWAKQTPSVAETSVDPSPADLEQGVHAPKSRPKHSGSDAEKSQDKGGKKPLEPSENFTGHQKFYIFFLDGLGGMALSGGVNFAIAYGEDIHRNEFRK